MVHFLPMKSATSPAMIAPKKVQAERIEVIREVSAVERTDSVFGVSGGSMTGSEHIVNLLISVARTYKANR